MVAIGARIRKVVRAAFFVVAVSAVIATPLVAIALRKEPRKAGIVIAGIFTFLATPMSTWAIAQHLESYTEPKLQRYIVRILAMVPIYALNSWFALVFPHVAFYLNTPRECYEAFVIYSFYMFLMSYLEKMEGPVDALLARKPQVGHVWPLNYLLHDWRMGSPFLSRCKAGILTYVVLRPVTTLIAISTYLAGVYRDPDSSASFDRAFIYCTVANNISQAVAVYGLIQLYRATHEELLPLKPLAKFMCVKGVVFVSYWQSLLIEALVRLEYIADKKGGTDSEGIDAEQRATSIQDGLICVEMFIAAIAHAIAFSPKAYRGDLPASQPVHRNLIDMLDLRDVYEDVKLEGTRFWQRHGGAPGIFLGACGLHSKRKRSEGSSQVYDDHDDLEHGNGATIEMVNTNEHAALLTEDALQPMQCAAEKESGSEGASSSQVSARNVSSGSSAITPLKGRNNVGDGRQGTSDADSKESTDVSRSNSDR